MPQLGSDGPSDIATEDEMQFRKVVIWSLVNRKYHPQVTTDEKRISGTMDLIAHMFPGINYFSITGHSTVLHDLVIPVLKKRFADLIETPPESVSPDDMVEIDEIMPSRGYEWEDNQEWQEGFRKLLEG